MADTGFAENYFDLKHGTNCWEMLKVPAHLMEGAKNNFDSSSGVTLSLRGRAMVEEGPAPSLLDLQQNHLIYKHLIYFKEA